MATELRLRRGTTAENDAFTGAEGELSYDTQRNELRIHDGVTPGGIIVASTNGAEPANFSEMPQVSGVPVVESGSNSDGEWTRWADGTQVTFRRFVLDTSGSSAGTARLHTIIPHPIPFDVVASDIVFALDIPFHSGAQFTDLTRTSLHQWGTSGTGDPTGVSISAFTDAGAVTVGSSEISNCSLTATGRWS